MGEFGIGQPVRRKEDVRLLTGGGQFTDDIDIEGQAYAAFVRSPHANAKIMAIDTLAARSMEGVIAVYTGQDLVDAGMGVMAGLTGAGGVSEGKGLTAAGDAGCRSSITTSIVDCGDSGSGADAARQAHTAAPAWTASTAHHSAPR